MMDPQELLTPKGDSDQPFVAGGPIPQQQLPGLRPAALMATGAPPSTLTGPEASWILQLISEVREGLDDCLAKGFKMVREELKGDMKRWEQNQEVKLNFSLSRPEFGIGASELGPEGSGTSTDPGRVAGQDSAAAGQIVVRPPDIEQMAIRERMQRRLYPFGGTAPQRWIRNMELWFKEYATTEKAQFDIARDYLGRETLHHWIVHMSNYEQAWEGVRQFLMDWYGETNTQEILDQLHAIKWKGSVLQLSREVVNTTEGHEEIDERLLIDTFVGRLPLPLLHAGRALRRPGMTPTEIFSHYRKAEQAILEDERRAWAAAGRSGPVLNSCLRVRQSPSGSEVQDATRQPSRPLNNGEQFKGVQRASGARPIKTGPVRNQMRRGSGEPPPTARLEDPRCFRCGGQGHLRRNCPKTEMDNKDEQRGEVQRASSSAWRGNAKA